MTSLGDKFFWPFLKLQLAQHMLLWDSSSKVGCGVYAKAHCSKVFVVIVMGTSISRRLSRIGSTLKAMILIER
ncbi:hypothetical protein DSO57_1015396 [Entomophthora muscae]|uniref:Uncharacterized protein n=1 Tax=Entomophthora muscae TaxID=34485 RepID=A0ACC2TS57_9FUNG|nr:hypothetical protein DSO57_1015396 [Entomophthora muscae]